MLEVPVLSISFPWTQELQAEVTKCTLLSKGLEKPCPCPAWTSEVSFAVCDFHTSACGKGNRVEQL